MHLGQISGAVCSFLIVSHCWLHVAARGAMLWRQTLLLACSFILITTANDEPSADKYNQHDCRCWAAQGQCDSNAEWMMFSCAASCARHATCERALAHESQFSSKAQIQELTDELEKVRSDASRHNAEINETIAALAAAQARIAELEHQISQVETAEGFTSKHSPSNESVVTERCSAAASQSLEALVASQGSAADRISSLEEKLAQQDAENKNAIDNLKKENEIREKELLSKIRVLQDVVASSWGDKAIDDIAKAHIIKPSDAHPHAGQQAGGGIISWLARMKDSIVHMTARASLIFWDRLWPSLVIFSSTGLIALKDVANRTQETLLQLVVQLPVQAKGGHSNLFEGRGASFTMLLVLASVCIVGLLYVSRKFLWYLLWPLRALMQCLLWPVRMILRCFYCRCSWAKKESKTGQAFLESSNPERSFLKIGNQQAQGDVRFNETQGLHQAGNGHVFGEPYGGAAQPPAPRSQTAPSLQPPLPSAGGHLGIGSAQQPPVGFSPKLPSPPMRPSRVPLPSGAPPAFGGITPPSGRSPRQVPTPVSSWSSPFQASAPQTKSASPRQAAPAVTVAASSNAAEDSDGGLDA